MTQPNAKLVEVAKIIAVADWRGAGYSDEACDARAEAVWPGYVDAARAAIRALMGADDKAKEAGWDAEDDGVMIVDSPRQAGIVFDAMLAKVLEEEG